MGSCDMFYDENTSCQDRFTNTCDIRTCYDEVAFIRAIVEYVRNSYCLDVNSVHMSGSSNGGMLAYSSLNRPDIFSLDHKSVIRDNRADCKWLLHFQTTVVLAGFVLFKVLHVSLIKEQK